MKPDHWPSDEGGPLVSWDDMGAGAPTVIALAQVCAKALARDNRPLPELSPEARAILSAARDRGVIEIKGTNNAFNSIERFLAVCIDLDGERTLVLRSRQDPTVTVRFLDAFRELCAARLAMHHLYREFSLTTAGFELARATDPKEAEPLLALGYEV